MFFLSSWYFGKISRPDAENRLRAPGLPTGCYLIRECHTSSGDYALSVRNGDVGVYNYRIRTVKSDMGLTTAYSMDGQIYFPNLSSLIDHYRHDAHGLRCKLTQPLGTADGFNEEIFEEGNICRHAS